MAPKRGKKKVRSIFVDTSGVSQPVKTTQQVAAIANKQINKRSETKLIESDHGAASVPLAAGRGTFGNMNTQRLIPSIIQGSARNNRDGNKLTITYIYLRYTWTRTDAVGTTVYVRMMIFRSNKATLIAANDLPRNVYQPLPSTTGEVKKVYMDKIFKLTGQNDMQKSMIKKKYITFKKGLREIFENIGNQPTDNFLHIAWITQIATGAVTAESADLDYICRVGFKDF